MVEVAPEAVARRSRLFGGICDAFAAICSLFYGVAWLQGGERAPVVVFSTTVTVVVAIVAGRLSHRGQLTQALHLLVGLVCIVITGTTFIAGRGGPVLVSMLLLASLSTLHLRRVHMLADFALVGASTALIVALVPPMDSPAYYATVVILLLLIAAIGYASSRIAEADLAEIHASNQALRAITTDLAAATRRAEQASAAKTMFLASISHELRTPLNAVLGYAEMVRSELASDDFDPAEADADLERVEQAGRVLLGHVSRILDLTRIEADEPDWQDVHLEPLLARILETHRAEAEQKGLTLDLTMELEPSHRVRTDRSRLERLIDNLIENAVRFTEAGGVQVVAEPCDDGVQVVVEDTGIGIPASELERIFELFTQVDQSTTRRVEGVGLGLHLVDRLAQTLGATLHLESEVGRGTRVVVRL